MIKKIIYDITVKEGKEKSKTMRDNFSPGDSLKCKRQLYYKNTKTTESNPITDHTYIKFKMGQSVEMVVDKIFEQYSLQSPDFTFYKPELKEKTISDGRINIKYIPDYIIESKGKKAIMELKSTYMAGWNSVDKEPKQEHVFQLMWYMLLEEIYTGTLLYIGRDNGFMVEYNFNLTNEELKEKLKPELKKWLSIKECIKNETLPERDFQAYFKYYNGTILEKFQMKGIKYNTPWQCGYCNWKDTCYKNEIETVKKEQSFYIGDK